VGCEGGGWKWKGFIALGGAWAGSYPGNKIKKTTQGKIGKKKKCTGGGGDRERRVRVAGDKYRRKKRRAFSKGKKS